MNASTLPAVGTALPELRRVLRTADLVAYAGATWDWHRLHYDQAFAASRSLDAPIVDGQMLGALLAEHVHDALGLKARVVRMAFRFSALVYADEEVVVHGIVSSVDETENGYRVTVTHSIDAPGGTAIKDAVTVAVVSR
jgi:acyl dehydratase